MSKTKKIISIICVVLVLISCFTVFSFADTYTSNNVFQGDRIMNIEFGDGYTDCYTIVETEDGMFSQKAWTGLIVGGYPYYRDPSAYLFEFIGDFKANKTYHVHLVFGFDDKWRAKNKDLFENMMSSFKTDIVLYNGDDVTFNFYPSDPSALAERYNEDNMQIGNITEIAWGSHANIEFAMSDKSYHTYEIHFTCWIGKDTTTLPIMFYNTAFEIWNKNTYKEDYEKSEANKGGNSNVNDLLNIVPNDTDGLLNSIKNLTSSLSYNGTEAKLKVPKISIPAISGVIPETQLIDGLEIDFGYWVEKIPSNILNLVRALSTIGLIMFCVRELYGWIQYILTMRKGDGNE